MRVVQVYSYGSVSNFTYSSVEMVTFIVLKRNDAACEDVFVIEDTVDGKHFFGYSAYTFRHIFIKKGQKQITLFFIKEYTLLQVLIKSSALEKLRCHILVKDWRTEVQ